MHQSIASLALLTLSLVMMGSAYVGWRVARRTFRVPVIADLIFFFVFLKMVMYYAAPAILRTLSGFQFERAEHVDPFAVVTIYGIEVVSWAVWIFALFVASSFSRGRKIDLAAFLRVNFRESRLLLMLLAIGLIVGQWASLNFLEPHPLLEPFKSLVFYAGVGAGPTLMLLSLKTYRSRALALLGVAASLMSLLSLSTRGALIYSALFCVFLAWFIGRDRVVKRLIAGLFATMAALYFTLGGLFVGQITIDPQEGMRLTSGVDAEKRESRSPIDEVEWRFGASTRMGTAFVRMYDRGDGAGSKPIMNSLAGFLPRSLDPNKPHPSTTDGENIYSQGMYQIYQETYGGNTASMVEFPTGGHFYWEFGTWGVVLLSAVSGLYVALCASFFSRLGLIAVPLVLALFKPWGFVDPKIWVSDIALQMYQVILPLIALLLIVRGTRAFLLATGRMLHYAAAMAEPLAVGNAKRGGRISRFLLLDGVVAHSRREAAASAPRP